MSQANLSAAEHGGELLTYPGYRGHFQAAVRFSGSGGDFHCEVGVFDTSFQDESESHSNSFSVAGLAVLRWQEIAPGPEPDTLISLPRRRSFTPAAMPFRTVTRDSVILLKVSRGVPGECDFTFTDSYLGSVGLDFTWDVAQTIPAAAASPEVLTVAAVRVDPASGNAEVMQLHHGVATLWVPLEPGEAVSDSSDSSSSPSESSSSPSEDPPPPPPESSSSPSEDPPPPESSSSPSVDPPPPPPLPESSSSLSGDPPPPPPGPSDSSDSSTSSGSADRIEVRAVLRIDFSDPQSSTVTTLSGWFDPTAPNSDGSFSVTLTGEDTLLEYDEPVYVEPASASWQIFPNQEANRWEVRSGGVLLSALRYEIMIADPEADDMSIETTVSRFPPLDLHPNYPLGTIEVQREKVCGASLETPIWVQVDTAEIVFSASNSGSGEGSNGAEI